VAWANGLTSVLICAPHSETHKVVIGRLRITVSGVPIGNISFKILIARNTTTPKQIGEAQRYHTVFVSYDSIDRGEVLKRVQMLKLFNIKIFQDILSLDPGSRWEKRLYTEIEHCDLFLLFWSRAARDSEWVRKELRYALACKKGKEEAPPDIIPVMIEGPPPIPPPPELSHLHFNDYLLYLMHG
jgi:hypothetical protein